MGVRYAFFGAWASLAISGCAGNSGGARGDGSLESGIDPDAGGADESDGGEGDGPDKLDIGDGMGENGGAEGSDGCQAYEITVEVRPSNVMLVLDYSITMREPFHGQTRWAGLVHAVEHVVETYDDRIHLGATLFPDKSAQSINSCKENEVEAPVASMNGELVLQKLPGPNASPPGNTPTRKGVLLAANHLETLDPSIQRAIVLVTDGEARCKPGHADQETIDDGVPDIVGQIWQERGIPTYVLGMALNATAKDLLEQMAQQGGAPNPVGTKSYYAADDPEQLEVAFDAISGEVIGCIVDLQSKPLDAELFEITVDGVVYGQVTSCDTEDGWLFVPGSDDMQIELCGEACSGFKATGSLQALQECPPEG